MDQNQTQCEKDNAINACRQAKKEVQENSKCPHANTPAKPACSNVVSTCCVLSPVSPAPVAQYNPCTKNKYCTKSLCKNVNNKCGESELTDYGKEYTSEPIGSITQICICVKHNGLQDTCKHPGCCTKVGCLDDPLPTCLPGKKWKQNYNRNKKISDECYD